MKKTMAVFLLLAICLFGCDGENDALARAMQLRTSLLSAKMGSFDACVTADFGVDSYTFCMACTFDADGNIAFRVTEPETIADITGSISASGGKLTFDDTALAFPLMGDGQLSPVSAPYLLLKALRGGYVRCCALEQGMCRVTVDDSYDADAHMLDIWLDEENLPIQADIYEENRRTMTLTIEKFLLT